MAFLQVFRHFLILCLTIRRLLFIIFADMKRVFKYPLPNRSEGGNLMSQVRVKENESLDSALRRFKRQTSRDGIIQEVRKREHYEKPSVARKKKSEAARKRKYK